MPENLTMSDAATVLMNCAVDTIEFCLTDDILPRFHAWLITQPGVSPTYTLSNIREDMTTILAAARGDDHPNVVYH